MKKKIFVLTITGLILGFSAGCSRDDISISTVASSEEEMLEEELSELEQVEHTADEMVTVHTVMQPQYYSPKIYVYVCGKVLRPGVYELPQGSRIYEAIDMAGGMTEEACAEQVNQALPIEDGMQITVPGPEDIIARQKEIKEAGLININQADVSELMKLTGIGESRAGAIVEYRQNQGLFTCIEDIMNVPGIKQGAFEKIKNQIVAE